MENKSIWNKFVKCEYESLDKDLECDVLIIGGGIAGVLSAFYLENSNLKVLLVERNMIGSGITSRMTAKVTLFQDILTKINKENIITYLKSQLEGIKLLKENIKKYKIECDFLENDSYLSATKISDLIKLEEIEKFFKKLDIKCYKKNLHLDYLKTYGALLSNSYEINPIKYLNTIKRLCKNTKIFENTNIVEVIKNNDLYVARDIKNHKIIAKSIVFATNYPYFVKPLFFPVNVRVEKSYIAYGSPNFKYENRFNMINLKGDKSIRFYKDKMIYLNVSKNLSNKVNDKECFKELKKNNLLKTYDNIWSNTDIITNDSLPIVGEVLDNLYILTGFNAWGLLSSHMGAKLISNLIKKEDVNLEFKKTFDPYRSLTIKKITNDLINIVSNINGYLKGMFVKNNIIIYGDKGIYIDKSGKMYPVKRKCPHMKCNLIFNEVELTWDCPCHASRFDIYGNLISGPSKYDIKIDKDM